MLNCSLDFVDPPGPSAHLQYCEEDTRCLTDRSDSLTPTYTGALPKQYKLKHTIIPHEVSSSSSDLARTLNGFV